MPYKRNKNPIAYYKKVAIFSSGKRWISGTKAPSSG
jgi:hypothetical protein